MIPVSKVYRIKVNKERLLKMVNEEKLKIMTAIARQENKYEKELSKNTLFYKKDYIRFHVLSVIWSYTIAYFLIVFLIALYNINYILLNFVTIDYVTVGMVLFFSYMLIILLAIFISRMYYSEKYNKEQKLLENYYSDLLKLKKHYSEDGKETQDVNTVGN